MRKLHLAAALAAALIAPSAMAQVTLAGSDFSLGADGWTATNGAVRFQYRDTEGDPGGFILAADFSAESLWFFSAPAAFLGDQSAALGGTLSFSMKSQSTAAPLPGQRADVQLLGTNGVLLSYAGGVLPTDTWTTYAVPLAAGGWTVGSIAGPAATQADLLGVLSSLKELRIRGDYRQSIDATGLDNVILSAVPEPSAAALLLAGLVFVAARRRRG